MIVWRRISTPFFSASTSALRSGRTLKPMMMAPDADARSTSLVLIAPTPAWRSEILTFSLERPWIACERTSTDPATSAFTIRGSSLIRPSWILLKSWSSEILEEAAITLSRSFCWRKETIERAFVSSSTTWNVSPARGRSSKPVTSTGVAAPPTATFAPRSSCMERTRPKPDPAKKTSLTESVPDCTSTVTTFPRPASRRASSTTPRASSASGAVSSCMSATRSSSPTRCSTPVFSNAEISTDGPSPPHDSRRTPRSASSFLTRSGLALFLSILLIATTIGTFAARAWSIASIVCGMTPSSAATTSTTMSVAFAPRERIEVKASWAGGSRKTIGLALDARRPARGGRFALLRHLRRAGQLQLFFEGDDGRLDADFPGDLDRGLRVESLVDGCEDAAPHEETHDVLREDAQFLRQFLDGHSLRQEDRAGRQGLLELQQLPGVVGARLFGGSPQGGLGHRLGRGRLLGLRALFDQGESDVGIRVFLVRPHELAQVHLVGDRDLRLGPALLGRLLGLLRVLLALGEPASLRRSDRSHAGSGGTAGPADGSSRASRLARERRTAADGTGARPAGRRGGDGGGLGRRGLARRGD